MKYSYLLLLCSACLFSCSYTSTPTKHISNLPSPPEGYKWVVNEDFSDEFNGNQLDETKWYRKSPHWPNGRPPATFKAENVSVKDGYLRITNRFLEHKEGKDGKPGDIYYLSGGAVASKSDKAFYGYYECRMKASKTTMSSTFWMKNAPEKQILNIDGKEIECSVRQELDIQETVGDPKVLEEEKKSWVLNTNKRIGSNTHYNYYYKDPVTGKHIKGHKSVSGSCENIENTSEVFHTYGCWWKDATTLDFYLDGKYVFTIHPDTTLDKEPFSRPMYMHMVTETYDWEKVRPTVEDLKDEEKATTLYDWVRSYKLVPKENASL